MALRDMTERQAAEFIGRTEAMIENMLRQQRPPAPQPQRRTVPALRKPMGTPLKGGGAGPTLTTHDLGNTRGEDATAYIRRRQQQMKGQR